MQVAVTSYFGAKHRGFSFRLFQDDFGEKQLWDGLSSALVDSASYPQWYDI